MPAKSSPFYQQATFSTTSAHFKRQPEPPQRPKTIATEEVYGPPNPIFLFRKLQFQLSTNQQFWHNLTLAERELLYHYYDRE